MEQVLTSKQAAGYLQMSVYSIRRYCKEGLLSHYFINGKQLRIPQSGLMKILVPIETNGTAVKSARLKDGI